MSVRQSPETARRRVAALELTLGRRERLERSLQAGVLAARDAHAKAVAQRGAQLARTEAEREQLRSFHAKIAHMMTGGNAFQLTDLNATMRHADFVAVRVQQMEGELAALDTLLRSKADDLAVATRAHALNRSRIDICSERIAGLRVALDSHVTDAGDEDAEEAALARLRFTSRGHGAMV
ncbi:type III secretion protein [Cupriavidus sp. AcVe19-6a]|nr:MULTISPECIES: type III secretion protein [unclassified Cupriavidus]MBP0633572.1 type III secretion protein [Cupriavidus sp. AcVe19-1a]MBP0640012.1 type III secretion protein [Cupriavidus sp. AcVe19-6a]